MSRLRGDDDLLSLMDEMSSQKGYEPAASLSEQNGTKSAQFLSQGVRLASEVKGYPSKKLVGIDMIWNPYTQVIAAVPSSRCMLLPTNPHVEIFRRRAYERFKSTFRANLERISVSATAKVGPSNLWSELSAPSMMERWHFDAKLQEFLNNDRLLHSIFKKESANVATYQIKSALEQRMIDPVLLSTLDSGKKRKRGEARNKSNRSASNLLLNEVKFEWTRAWKRIAGEAYNESDLKPIFDSKRFQKKASRLSRSVMEAVTEADAFFHDQVGKRAAMEAHQSGRPSKKSSIPKLLIEGDEVFVKFSGLSFRLNQEHYQKLQIMFDRMHPNSCDRTAHEFDFCSSLFCLLARYDMLQGAGLQSSMHGAVFDVLLQHYDCRLECFASPLNSRYEKFCSAFIDTDAPFGSVGSFFDYDFQVGGCYQANPPFATNFITNMYETIEKALELCKEPLMFLVFVPSWKETTGWNLLHDSPYVTKHVSLSQSSHCYAEGTQHRRKDRYRVASFDTCVFFLQNEAAERKWPITDSQIAELKAAFQMDPNQTKQQVTTKPPAEPSAAPVAATERRPTKSIKRNDEQGEQKMPSKPKKKKKAKEKGKAPLTVEEEGAHQLDILTSIGFSEQPAGRANKKKKRK